MKPFPTGAPVFGSLLLLAFIGESNEGVGDVVVVLLQTPIGNVRDVTVETFFKKSDELGQVALVPGKDQPAVLQIDLGVGSVAQGGGVLLSCAGL